MFSSNTTQESDGGYQISRSLRFNRADAATLTRTPASASNQKTWTWSGWIKRGRLGIDTYLFSSGTNASNITLIRFKSDDTLRIYTYDNSNFVSQLLDTTAVFRDPSAWYHIVGVHDTTQAVAADRVKLYVNGVQQVGTAVGTVPQNSNGVVNSTNQHILGPTSSYAGQEFDGYMTEINFINGQALTPSSFGQTNAQTGVWEPKAYSGSYGTNGFYLNFSDNSNTTAATLGKDYSGNGNNWTPNNFSVSAGAGNDSLVDTPTPYGSDTGAGGEVRGNYCTFNPLKIDTNLSLANGNLDLTRANSSGWKNAEATVGVQSGKWYFEITPTGANLPANFMLGVGDPTQIAVDAYLGGTSRVWGYQGNGNYYNNGTTYGSKPTISANDVVMVAYDLDSGKLWFGKNGSWNGGGSPASGTSADFTNLTGTISAAAGWFAAGTAHINFGQRPFAYTAPSGFKALCTQNLPTPTIGATTATQAGNYFVPTAYTGNGSSSRAISNGINMAANGGLVWTKQRSGVEWHFLIDNIRGNTKYLSSNATNAEGTISTLVTGFDSTGYSIGNDSGINSNGSTYVSWAWGAGGSGVTNTAGSITSTVSANTTSGFSIVTYTGAAGTGGTVGHGLGAAPRMVIVKCRGANTSTSWPVYHASLGAGNYLKLNDTSASASSTDMWNNTAPTSTVFSVGTLNNWASGSSLDTYVAYCFAEVPGFSAFGSYTGNGSTDGPFVFTGFRPAFVMVKRTDTTSNWTVLDSKRIGYNADNNQLYPNLSDAETTTDLADLLSNGFKSRSTDASVNASGGTYIYMALAENPFKFSLAR